MKEAIGGYFELELRPGRELHGSAIKLNTARNCLEYILLARNCKKIYLPYYACDVILEPIKKCRVDYEFYSVNEQLEPTQTYALKVDEAFLYINYFGLKQACARNLALLYGRQLIIDNSQAFYSEAPIGIDTFYSARKFFGVADGAYLYTDTLLDEVLPQDTSFLRMTHLMKRIDLDAESGYGDFKANEELLSCQPILKMSKLTERILKSVDYERAKHARIGHFKFLEEQLKNKNLLNLRADNDTVPMVYPLWVHNGKNIRKKLIENNVFVPAYWPNVHEWVNNAQSIEYYLADNLIPLPIDQRYGIEDMIRILNNDIT